MNELEKLKSQLKVARDEISNLRTQISSLNHVHRKEINGIKQTLQSFRCLSCSAKTPQRETEGEESIPSKDIKFQPIGFIRTAFADKRAVPRQSTLAETLMSRVELCKELYTNPEQSLETLEDFSHIWIIYHFNHNEPHFKPKISPPRLDGKRVGVLATRSPHRPNPIGMSLVKIHRIERSEIHFFGGDMVDGTPVLDIKPFIPQYDSPQKTVNYETETTVARMSRSEPEGEEEHSCVAPSTSDTEVRVPEWISDKKHLAVMFSDNALKQIQELGINQRTIQEILENDPRSVYVREKYLSQIYNFQLSGNNVICKFDDKGGTVNVLQIRKLAALTE